ncbi:MAG: DNA-directed RNA polymerase subunit omega [Blautia sp.]|nr:DNA-directed RNA polymerase subunit omega [Blautia sp.]
MIHPSYNELIEAINANTEDNDNTILMNSRYSLVLATSKRARQLISGSHALVDSDPGEKPLSIAIEEIYKGKVKIKEDTEAIEEEEAENKEAEEQEIEDHILQTEEEAASEEAPSEDAPSEE